MIHSTKDIVCVGLFSLLPFCYSFPNWALEDVSPLLHIFCLTPGPLPGVTESHNDQAARDPLVNNQTCLCMYSLAFVCACEITNEVLFTPRQERTSMTRTREKWKASLSLASSWTQGLFGGNSVIGHFAWTTDDDATLLFKVVIATERSERKWIYEPVKSENIFALKQNDTCKTKDYWKYWKHEYWSRMLQ